VPKAKDLSRPIHPKNLKTPPSRRLSYKSRIHPEQPAAPQPINQKHEYSPATAKGCTALGVWNLNMHRRRSSNNRARHARTEHPRLHHDPPSTSPPSLPEATSSSSKPVAASSRSTRFVTASLIELAITLIPPHQQNTSSHAPHPRAPSRPADVPTEPDGRLRGVRRPSDCRTASRNFSHQLAKGRFPLSK
jgi:hypothetical protein